jgi:Flp pilus assembly protein TadD
MSLWASGNSKAAVAQYRRVLEMKPDWRMAANTLAWVLATDMDKDVRNGDAAVNWAQAAVQGKHRNDPQFLDTLAAAYAETGQFDRAVRIIQQALSVAEDSGDKGLRESIEERLRLYQSGKPFRE